MSERTSHSYGLCGKCHGVITDDEHVCIGKKEPRYFVTGPNKDGLWKLRESEGHHAIAVFYEKVIADRFCELGNAATDLRSMLDETKGDVR